MELAKVDSFTTVCPVSILGWAAASNERAVANAREAAVECSRRRLERAEIADAVAELTAPYAGPRTRPATAADGHEVRAAAQAR
jgi:hypothetical protein